MAAAEPAAVAATSRRDIRSHHSIRGIAAFLVLVLHFEEILAWSAIDVASRTSFIGKGYLWVDCFFILSGFILSYVYAESMYIKELPGFRQATARFLRARFARVYPLQLFTLGLILAIQASVAWVYSRNDGLFTRDNNVATFLTNTLLIHGWGIHNHLSWNRPSWSVSTEAFAYLLFPLLCIARFMMRRFFLALLIAVPVLGYSILLGVKDDLDQTFHLGLLRCVTGFVLGMALFRLWAGMDRRTLLRLHVLQVPIVVAIVVTMHFGLHDTFTVALFSLLVLTTADDEGTVAKILQKPAMVWLGMISYSIYMLQYPILRFAVEYKWFLFDRWVAHGNVNPRTLSIVLFLAFGAIALGAATLSYRFIELPARRRLGKRP